MLFYLSTDKSRLSGTLPWKSTPGSSKGMGTPQTLPYQECRLGPSCSPNPHKVPLRYSHPNNSRCWGSAGHRALFTPPALPGGLGHAGSLGKAFSFTAWEAGAPLPAGAPLTSLPCGEPPEPSPSPSPSPSPERARRSHLPGRAGPGWDGRAPLSRTSRAS